MSLKSFDKFCEKLILAESGSEKAIFDERQKIIRSRLTIEALLIYACITLINTVFMDTVYQWAERHFSAMLLIMNVCLFYWLIRCAAKDCIIAANGSNALKASSIMIICISTPNFIARCFHIADGVCLLKDGRLTDEFMQIVSFLFLLIDGIFCLCYINYYNKKNGGK